MLFTLLAFVVALGTLITFHELGHYWIARLCGVRVLRFSVGFGRVLARRTDRHGTEWAISCRCKKEAVVSRAILPFALSVTYVANALRSGARTPIRERAPCYTSPASTTPL